MKIYQFTGTPIYNNKYVCGGVTILNWSQLQPQFGVYDWTRVDRAINDRASHGQRAAFRIQTAIGGASYTPDWLYTTFGVRKVTYPDGTVAPVYWDLGYRLALQQLINAFAARYDQNTHIEWVQAGIGMYGETKPDTGHDPELDVWGPLGYTDQTWFTTIQQICGFYTSAFRRTPVVVAPLHSSFFEGSITFDTLLSWLPAHGVRPQCDWLRSDTTLPEAGWQAGPFLAEQFQATSVTGETLEGNLANIQSLGAPYALIYGSDLADPANQDAIKKYGTIRCLT